MDILEPHDDTRLDTWAKVKGLAKFGDEHGVAFGRLMVGRKIGDALQVVDVADHQTREKARRDGSARRPGRSYLRKWGSEPIMLSVLSLIDRFGGISPGTVGLHN